MKNRIYASALIAVIAFSAAWTGIMVYRQRPALPVGGLLHRSTVDPTVDRGGHSRGIVQVNLLRQIMTDRARNAPTNPKTDHKVATQSHPLLGQPAPPLVLNDASGKTWNLHDEAQHGPVVVVFYLGSTCMACVTHLTALEVAMARFTARNTRVLAVSADTPEFSVERMHKYGTLEIPLLSDANHTVSTAYGVWKAAPGGSDDDGLALHGTFIIDREGMVRWARVGDRPFTDVEALLAALDAPHLEPSSPHGSSASSRRLELSGGLGSPALGSASRPLTP